MMRKWLSAVLAITMVLAGAGVASAADDRISFEELDAVEAIDENPVEPEQEKEEEFNPYIGLDELQELTPKIVEKDNVVNVVPSDLPKAETAPEEPEKPVKLEGKTTEEMSDSERSAAQFIWEDQLYGKSFVLDTVNGKTLSGPRPVTMKFDNMGKLSGRICNTFSTAPEFSNMVFKATDIATTRMACPDHELAELEKEFLKNLHLGIGYYLAGDNLELRRDGMVLVFRPAGAAPIARPAPAAKPAPATKPAPAPKPAAKPAPVAPAPAAPIAARPAPVATPPSAPVGGVQESDLVGRHFVLAKVDGKNFAPDMGEQPFIQFDQGMRVSGKACNSFRGPGQLADGVLTVENAASTMMMCIDAKLNEYERDLYRLLRGGMRVTVTPDQLTLSGGGREFVYYSN